MHRSKDIIIKQDFRQLFEVKNWFCLPVCVCPKTLTYRDGDKRLNKINFSFPLLKKPAIFAGKHL